MRTRTFLALLLLAVVPTTGLAQGLPSAEPAAVDLSGPRLDRLEEVVQGYVHSQAGAVTLIARHGSQAYIQAYGLADRADGAMMQADTTFRPSTGWLSAATETICGV